jgi:serine protease AprX
MSGACPACYREASLAVTPLERSDLALLSGNIPALGVERVLCRECADRFADALKFLKARYPLFGQGGTPILPIAVRLGAFEAFSGRGVGIAFLDSGFYAHPDLVKPKDRLLAYVDITRRGARRRDLDRPDESAWHGMMTSVVACGNGELSGGLYKGLASRSGLVLVKCGTARRIVHDDIRRGLLWVIRNRRRYGIRVVNVSCGGDYEASYLTDGLSQAAELATREGLLVCAAVGNTGHMPGHPVLPPASAPSVLAVGGLDDHNQLSVSRYGMYPSSFGPTRDGLQKPEVIAPAIFVAAPLLPGSAVAARAAFLVDLGSQDDTGLREALAARPEEEPELQARSALPSSELRRAVAERVRDERLISGSYVHVDGTSFASPIVASIAAQMFEANPRLTPQEAKHILVTTARRVPGIDPDRQGWGVVDPRAAVLAALQSPGKSERGASAPLGTAH